MFGFISKMFIGLLSFSGSLASTANSFIHSFHLISKKSTSIDLKKNIKNAITISNNYNKKITHIKQYR